MARPRHAAADPVSMLGARPPLEPLPNESFNLSLAGLGMLPSQLLPQHRLSHLEESQGGLESGGNQLLFRRGHAPSVAEGSLLPYIPLHRRQGI